MKCINSYENNRRLEEWLRRRAAERFRGKVAVVAIYGSYVNGTANEFSDIDCFFVPKTDEGYDFCADFILGGVGYDIYPIDWGRLERIAALDDRLLPCLGDSVVIYADTEEDEARFMALRERMKENIAGARAHEAALNKYSDALDIFSAYLPNDKLRDGRAAACFIAQFCADAAALELHSYYHFGLKTQYRDLCALPGVPERIPAAYIAISEALSCGELETLCRELLCEVCLLCGGEYREPEHVKPENNTASELDIPGLAGLYEEGSSTFNKIYYCAAKGDSLLAFISAVSLQYLFDEDVAPMGGGTCDLLDVYDHRDLAPLAQRTREAEARLVALIERGGGVIKRYDSFEAFEADNL